MGKGASAQQNQISQSQQSFMNTLQQDFGTAFAGQQNILSGLTKSLTSTLNAGPSQFGFSAPEVSALNSLAIQSNATAYENARAAAGAASAAAGGGANLPTGAAAATQAQLAQNAAVNQSNALLGIQEAGFKQGAENYKESVSGLSTVAGLENPSGLAGQATNAGDAAMNSATTIQKANAAASPWAQVGGLVGSLAGAALNFVPGAGAASSVIGSVGNIGKGLLSGLGAPTAPAVGDSTNYSGSDWSGLGSSPDLSGAGFTNFGG